MGGNSSSWRSGLTGKDSSIDHRNSEYKKLKSTGNEHSRICGTKWKGQIS